MALPAVEVKVTADTAQAVKGVDAVTDSLKDVPAASKKANDAAKTNVVALKQMGAASFLASNRSRMLTQQLSQVAQQTTATGQPLQALAIQAADIGLAFGTVGTIIGALAGIALPTLAAAFISVGDSASAAESAMESFGSADLGSVRGATSQLLAVQESYNDAVRQGGAASGSVAALVIANSEAEFNARRRVLDVERQLLSIRGQEQRATLRNLQDQQAIRQREASEAARNLGAGATGLSGGIGVPQPRFDADAFTAALDGRLGDLGENRLKIQKISAELELLGLAEQEALEVLQAEFGELSSVSGGEGGGGGGKGSTRLSTLLDGLRTEREALDQWREEGLARLATASEAELAALGGLNEAKLRLEEEYQERLRAIKLKGRETDLSMTLGAGSDILSALGSFNDKALKLAKVAGAAQALVSTYQGAAEALKLPFPANIAAAAAVTAKGLGLVAAIKGVSSSGGGGGGGAASGGSAAASAVSAQAPLQVSLAGISPEDIFTGAQVRGLLFDTLQSEAGDRGLSFV